MVRAMRTADDLFFDVISQIRMPAWSRGRVALVGDAAYAPSFLPGRAPAWRWWAPTCWRVRS